MSKIDIGPLSKLAEFDQFSIASDSSNKVEDGSLFRGFMWAAGAGMIFWIGLARLLFR